MNSREYKEYVLNRLDFLKSKDHYLLDMHIHTNHSADGKQSVIEAITKAQLNKFDIISITDHDSIAAYEEIINFSIKELDMFPIIIPGIEFSVSHVKYKGRCHILKYFIDMDNEDLKKNIIKNEMAYKTRALMQFELIKYNKVLEYFSNKKGLELSFSEYELFLGQKNARYEYVTLMEYIYIKLLDKGIDIWDIFEKRYQFNEYDECLDRKKAVKEALDKFYLKNRNANIKGDYYKLSRILAIVNIDDSDFIEFEPSGNLTVNQYNQVNIEELENSGFNILAHPNEILLKYYPLYEKYICGVECNYRSSESQNKASLELQQKFDTMLTFGSDSHSTRDIFYENLSFYYASKYIVERIYMKLKENDGSE